MTANGSWVKLIHDLQQKGREAKPRDQATKELLGYQSRIHMRYPVVTIKDRKLGYKFLAAEAAWILSGDNKVSSINRYSKQIADFSDDGHFFHGAYGPKIVDQLTHVVDCLVNDLDSRQAVINIWRENPRKTKDVPCTISVQFMVRDEGLFPAKTLHCFDTMRSSDAWLGWPYDVFNFSTLSGLVCLLYRERTGSQLKLGDLTLTAASQHLYERNFEAASTIEHGGQRWDYAPFDPNSFDSPDHLIDHLWAIANRTSSSKPEDFKNKFLVELVG